MIYTVFFEGGFIGMAFVRLPRGLVKRVEKLIKERSDLGYESVKEFIAVACLLKMDKLRSGEEGP